MLGLDNLQRKGKGPQVMHEIHVLLVDHDYEGRVNTANLLEFCQHKVTPVEFASTAISILSRGNVKFDMVMANINSPDSHGIGLLQQAVNMNLPIILMTADYNPVIAMKALENGAFLYIKKPITIEMISCLWQHVFRKKARIIGERNRLVASDYRGIEFTEGIIQDEKYLKNIADNNMLMMKNQGKFEKNIRGENSMNEDMSSSKKTNNNTARTKVHMEWTKELHAKFMDAIEQLGDGKCFPKEIRELMNVSGLTRMQVSSHLQKCRNDTWRSPEERNQKTIGSSNAGGSQSKPRRFGSMPRLGEGVSYQDQVQESRGARQSPQTNVEVVLPNNDAQINMKTGQITNNTSNHQFFGSMLAGSSNVTHGTTSSTKHKYPSDDFFIFQDMDCLIGNYSTQPQGSGMNNLNPPPQPTHFKPINLEQNSSMPSMGTRINWNSETSNFRSDES